MDEETILNRLLAAENQLQLLMMAISACIKVISTVKFDGLPAIKDELSQLSIKIEKLTKKAKIPNE